MEGTKNTSGNLKLKSQDLTLNEVNKVRNSSLNDSDPLYSMVKRWVSVFKMRLTNSSDKFHSKSPVEVTISEFFEKIH